MSMTTLEKQAAKDFAAELQTDAIGIELHLPTLGRRRRMSERHTSEVAEHYGAKRGAVGANKGLYLPNQPEIKKITSVLGAARNSWKMFTIQYRKGVRLLRKEHLDRWIETFEKHEVELEKALAEADANFDAILDASKEYLGDELFSRNDYPHKFLGWFRMSWEVSNLEPNEELLRLAPETYEREKARMRQRFEGAIAAYEQEAREQLQKLVVSLLEKLSDAKAGKKVVYTEAATSNLREFFDRFDSLGIKSDEALNELVDSAKQALGGITMYDLKKSEAKRTSIADSFSAVSEKLSQLIVEAPSRSISLDDLDE